MKRLRLIISAALIIPAMFFAWLTVTENGLNWAYQQAELYLPVKLNINKLEGRLIGPVTVKGFEYQQDGMSINAQQITLDWSPAALLAANININQLHIQSLAIVLPNTAETEQTQTQASRQTITLPEISLPWRLLLKDVEVDSLSVQQDEQVFKLNKIKLNATTLFSKINIKQLSIDAETFSLVMKGKLQPTRDYRHDLDVSWQFTLPSSEVIKGKGQLTGSMQKTHIIQTISEPLQLALDVTLINLLDQLNWTAKADITQFDIAKLDASWPALSGAATLDAEGDLSTATVTGKLKGKYPELGPLNADFNVQRLSNNTIQINRLQLLAPESNTTLNAEGSWQAGKTAGETGNNNGGNIKLVLNWQNLRWPAHDTPWFNSANGSGTIEGNIDSYQITLDSDSPWPQAAPSTWHASATGNLDGMKIQTLRINALNGEANVSGQLNWSPQLSWQAEGHLSNVDPATLWPQWPGQLEGKLSSKGRLQKGQLIGEADISQLKGKLRGYPVSLRSQLAWKNDQLNISQLNVSSGKSQLQLNGQLGETLNLSWSVDSKDLAELYPQAKGELQASGQLKGPSETPLIKATVNGKTLSYPNLEIAAIDAEMAVDLLRWQQIDIQLAAQALRINDFKLLSVDINSNAQEIKAKIVSSRATAQIALKGEAQASGWSGRIEKADVMSEYFDNWSLDSPAALSFDNKSLLIESLCWHSNQQAGLCASLKGDETNWHSSLNMASFPLKIFERWMPQDLKLESVANGKAEVEFQYPETLLAEIDINLPPGTVNYPMLSGENDRREYDGGKLQVSLNPQGLTASSTITMANGDRFTAQLALPEIKPLTGVRAEQPLKASAEIHAHDLRLIEALAPEIYNLQGELELKLHASGTLDQPILSGDTSIINGSLQIPGLGLHVEQVTLNGQSDASKNFNFRLDARSGDGNLVISGHTRLDRSAGWPTEINFSGKEFEVAHIPEARVQVSPDLQLKLKNRTIDIQGKVHIPYAKLQPKDITQAANVSSDAVIIGGEQPAEEKWLINTSVRLTLGDRVHFYGYGFEGRLGGDLLLEDEPGQLTKATGEITIPEGIYRAYGQRLEVENGRVLYTGGPLTNPGLDIRAVRKVNDVTAGIHVKGSLNKPRLEIFSTPAMAQTDALAYILLGGPIENATNEDGSMMAKAALALGLSGGDTIARSLGDRFGLDEMRVESSAKGDQAALVVGRYLSPKIYVSYGVGLIERVDTLTMRYQISKKWQLKVESGGYQGADILYTIER